MRYSYHVIHDEGAKPRLDQFWHPLDEQGQAREYDLFPDALDLFFANKADYVVDCVRATPPDHGLRITLTTMLSKDVADEELKVLLLRLNENRTRAFVVVFSSS